MSDEQRPAKPNDVDGLGFSPFRNEDGPTFPRNASRDASAASQTTPARAGDATPERAAGAPTAAVAPEREADATVLRPAVKPDTSPTSSTSDAARAGSVAGAGAAAGAAGAAARPARKPSRRTRKARLRLTRVDPWSVMKVSFLFSIAFGIMMWVSTYVVWNVVQSSGMFDSINETVNNVLGTRQSTFRLEDFINQSRVLGFTALLAAVDIVLFTAIATLFSFLYNLAASVLGGLEVTLAED